MTSILMLQVIISVSQLLGEIIGLNNSRFQESMALINSYASSDKAMNNTGQLLCMCACVHIRECMSTCGSACVCEV